MSAHSRGSDQGPGSPARPLRTVLLLLAALLPVLGLIVVAPQAGAHGTTGKVTFCHATSSTTNPYVTVTTDPASVLRRGHDHHTGPVWSPTLAAHTSWGDIIPAFSWVDSHGATHHYAGLNTDRLDVVRNGCVVPPISVTVSPPTSTDQTCSASGTVTIATVTGVGWTLDGVATTPGTHAVPPGTHTVKASALKGYAITGTSSWKLTVAPRTGCDSVVVTPVAPTVTPSGACGEQGTYTIPATDGVRYLVAGHAVAAGTYTGPVDAVVTAEALAGYRLADPAWSAALVVAPAATCPTRVTPVPPTSDPSPRCGTEGTYTIPATTGVEYLLDGDLVAAGTYAGPVDATVTARAAAGYTLTEPTWSVHLVVAPAEDCPVIVVVTPVDPTVVQSPSCGKQGSVTVPATEGLRYLLDGEPFAAGTHTGPVAGTVTAEALEGWTLANPEWSFTVAVAAAEACPVIVVVTPVDPTVTPSDECGVEGSYAIPSTAGVQYLLDGEPIAAGTYDGPQSGTVTATALEGYRLSTTTWSYALDLAAADTCSLPSTGGALAHTGGDSAPMAGIAALLLALGAGLVVASTRRPTTR